MTPDSLPVHPRFARHFSVQIVAGQGVVLFRDGQSRILTGPLHERLAGNMNGRRTADDIVALLGDEFPMEELYFVMLSLTREALVVDATDDSGSGADPALAAFWDELGAPAGSARRIESRTIVVESVQPRDGDEWSAALAAHGFTIGNSGVLRLVLAPDYLDTTLATINARALASGEPWMLCRATGTELWIGPLFVPGRSACWECLRARLAGTQSVRAFLTQRFASVPAAPRTAASWTTQAAVGLAATQLARILAHTAPHELAGVLTSVDTITLGSSHHRVTRRPQCSACGDSGLMSRHAGQAPELRSQLKRFTADGGHRIVAPEDTIARLAPFIDPLTGVVGELRRNAHPAPSIHVYTSGLNGAIAHRDLTGLSAGLRRSSSGKGFTEAQAKASALGEAIERHSAVFQGDEPRRRASYRELGDAAIHPARCLHFSDRQYAGESLPETGEHRDLWIPARFDEQAVIDWSPIWSMTELRTKYLPTALMYFAAYTDGHQFGLGDSNGNAAGNTLEEAILQGFLELVERDSTAMWWYNRVQRPAVDIEALGLAGWPAIRDYYDSVDREYWLLDITGDLGIPVFVAVSRERTGPREDILMGLGSHLDPRIAGSRAISEMNQMLSSLEVLREGVGVNDTLAHWLATSSVENQPYLVPRPGAAKQPANYSHVHSDDLLDDVRWCQRLIESRGLELLVLDQTRPDVGLPVVKVVVPELRHFRPRFAPGRLYDVPVSLGWLTRPTPESELNPFPFFL